MLLYVSLKWLEDFIENFIISYIITVAHSVNIPFVVSAIVFGLPIRMYEGNVCDYLTYGECPVLSGREFTAEIYYQIMDDIPIPTVCKSQILRKIIDFVAFHILPLICREYLWPLALLRGMILVMLEFALMLMA